ncbi:MAG: hypothetical protein KAT70_00445, partial [Thermoplasmata archaeon]|nr:hypothetical protein [Thermoplasmata archaeon]
NYTATLEVRDAVGNNDVDYVCIGVLEIEHHPPAIQGVPDIFIHYDHPYVLDLGPYITDAHSSPEDLTISTSQPVENIAVEGMFLSFTYPQSQLGNTLNVTITVEDEMGDKDSDFMGVHITDNYPPKLSAEIEDIEMYEGEVLLAFDLDDHFVDDNDDLLYYHYLGNEHVTISLNEDNEVTLSAMGNWGGIEIVAFRAYDPYGAFSETTLKITVISVNTPPSLSGVQDPIYMGYNMTYTLDLTPYVDDDSSIFDLQMTTDKPWITTTGLRLLLNYTGNFTPGTPLEKIVMVNLSDGENMVSEAIRVIITSNSPPIFSGGMDNVSFPEDGALEGAFDLNDHFSDPDGSISSFMESSREQNITVHIGEGGAVNFGSAENWSGQGYVVFIAVDDMGMTSMPIGIMVAVNPVNDAPYIRQSLMDISIEEGDAWIIDLDDYFGDIDSETLVFSCNYPEVYVDPFTHMAMWSFQGNDTLSNVVFTASDGELEVSSQPFELKAIRPTTEEVISPWLLPLLLISALGGAISVLVYWRITRKFAIEQAFLIHENGTLIHHIGALDREEVDEEILSSMLTGIQEFISEAFISVTDAGEEGVGLKKLEFGEKSILIERGGSFFIAVVFKGYVTEKLEKLLDQAAQAVEEGYGSILKEWSGSMNAVRGIDGTMECLFSDGEKGKK